MASPFIPAEWEIVLPGSRRRSVFCSPYFEPAAIVSQETGSDLEECVGCGQLRERVVSLVVGGTWAEVCSDCREKYGL